MQLHPLRVPLRPLGLRLAPYVPAPSYVVRSAKATDILLSRSHHQRAPEVMPYRSAQVLIFSSLDVTSSVRLKLCCTAAPRPLIFSSLDGTCSVCLKLCCTAVLGLLIFSSLDGDSCVRLKLCCTQARNQAGALRVVSPPSTAGTVR